MLIHAKEKCRERLILCPNVFLGCTNKTGIPLSSLEKHIENDCEGENQRRRKIENSKFRREPVQCSLCGELVPLMLMKKHEVKKY